MAGNGRGGLPGLVLALWARGLRAIGRQAIRGIATGDTNGAEPERRQQVTMKDALRLNC